jgi:hypothetical protein
MPAAELPFEIIGAALESTRGTAVTPPTHMLPMGGTMTPRRTKARPDEQRGTIEEFYRSKTVYTFNEFDYPGPADPNYAPFIYNLIAKANSTPTTPTNGVLTRLWTFLPTVTSDDIKSATLYGGDPNVQIFRAAYCMADEFTVSADATSDDMVTWNLKGIGQYPTPVTAPVFPASIAGNLIAPGAMQLWIDTTLAIGTTEITGRFIKTDWTLTTGVTRKRYANGPTGGLGFTKTGRAKRHGEASIVVELNDLSVGAGKEYLTWEADTVCKMRIRLNGPLIESVTPDYYEYLQLDIYGPLDALEWGDVEGSNRTMEFTVQSEYQSAVAASWVLYCQNQRVAL